jgi:hypothetical protein
MIFWQNKIIVEQGLHTFLGRLIDQNQYLVLPNQLQTESKLELQSNGPQRFQKQNYLFNVFTVKGLSLIYSIIISCVFILTI